MTRNDLAFLFSKRFSTTEVLAREMVDHVLDKMAEALVEGGKIEFRGFGVFDVVQRKSKIGRNPRCPAAGQYFIPARRMVRFRAGAALFDRLNPGS